MASARDEGVERAGRFHRLEEGLRQLVRGDFLRGDGVACLRQCQPGEIAHAGTFSSSFA
jgi:hypothetical protein